MRRWYSRRRAACAAAAVVALVGLIALGPVDPARADNSVDQITGNGVTQSAVTVRWADGLLGADNKTVVAPRDPDSPLAFMHADFQNLVVTVGQTENVVHQAIKVSWTGGRPTKGTFLAADYLQMMECYGDAEAGPEPENCEYGSDGLLPGTGVSGLYIGDRNGAICTSHTPSTTAPPGAVDGSFPLLGCDPGEPAGAHLDPNGSNQVYTVPFVPVDSTDRIYSPPTSYPFNRFNSNEVQQVATRPDGTGDVYFQALTKTEASGLGCGEVESNGRPRGCWLVIVPRGEYQPNGAALGPDSNVQTGMINESPLGASSWAQRIQIHLGYAPIQPNCPIGSAKEREMVGTEVVSRAVFSWQLALNAAAQCRTLYGYSATPEAASTSQLASPSGTGLAFTTVPIGNEIIRDGGTPATLPPLVYAPVAVSAITFGFNINLSHGFVSTPVKLTPRLLAKALTQSYRQDLTDFTNSNPGPDWALGNPLDMTHDPEFVNLNPDIGLKRGGAPVAPLLTADRSGVNQQVWAWIQADPAARAWLGGAPDENGMVVNPNYRGLRLGQPPAADSFPRADPTAFNTRPLDGEPDPGRRTIDLLPYVENFDDGASRVRAANNPEGSDWDKNALAPDGSTGWWLAPGTQLAGSTLMWTMADSASLASYGLVPAALCTADGTGCVSPGTTSVTAALRTARPDASGLLHVNPAAAGAGGYPLVTVAYAAVRATQEAAALTDYATLIAFVANQGQAPGVDPGQLPHGYLPLPANLRSAAAVAVAALLARARPAASPSATTAGTGGTGGNGNGNGGGGGTGSGADAGVPNPGAVPPPVAVGPSAPPYLTTQASPVAVAKTTGPASLGGVRWALLTVVLAGLAGSIGGPLLRLAFGRWAP
jgi:hypothetical protein